MRRTALHLLWLLPLLVSNVVAQSEKEPTPQEIACTNAPTTRCLIDLFVATGSSVTASQSPVLAAIAVADGIDAVLDTTLPIERDLRTDMPVDVGQALIDAGRLADARRAASMVKVDWLRSQLIGRIAWAHFDSGDLDAALELVSQLEMPALQRHVLEKFYWKLHTRGRPAEANRVKASFEALISSLDIATRRELATLALGEGLVGWMSPPPLLIDAALDLQLWAREAEARSNDEHPAYFKLTHIAAYASHTGRAELSDQLFARALVLARRETALDKIRALVALAAYQSRAGKPDQAMARYVESENVPTNIPQRFGSSHYALDAIFDELAARRRLDDARAFLENFRGTLHGRSVHSAMMEAFARADQFDAALSVMGEFAEPDRHDFIIRQMLRQRALFGDAIAAAEFARLRKWSDGDTRGNLSMYLDIAAMLVDKGHSASARELLRHANREAMRYRNSGAQTGISQNGYITVMNTFGRYFEPILIVYSAKARDYELAYDTAKSLAKSEGRYSYWRNIARAQVNNRDLDEAIQTIQLGIKSGLRSDPDALALVLGESSLLAALVAQYRKNP